VKRGAAGALGVALAGATPLAAAAGFLALYPDAPPPAMTGGFGEPTCFACHFATTPDTLGSLALRGLPATYEGRRSYELIVEIAREGVAAAGFELSARFASGQSRGRQAGAFRVLGGDVAVTGQAGVDYAHQTQSGSVPAGSGLARWRIEWTAPGAATDPVRFNVAANAGNGDKSPLGDRIYALEETVEPARVDSKERTSSRRARARRAVAATVGSASSAAVSSACLEPSPVFPATIAAFRASPLLRARSIAVSPNRASNPSPSTTSRSSSAGGQSPERARSRSSRVSGASRFQGQTS
jgi:hypothetical protein